MPSKQFNKLISVIFWLLLGVYSRVAMVGERVQGDEVWSLIYGYSALLYVLMASIAFIREAE